MVNAMEFLNPLWNYVLPFLVILTILVFVHEMGHYYIARRAGVRVEAFSIGFGPELFGWTDRHGTRWRFAAIPLGRPIRVAGQWLIPPRWCKGCAGRGSVARRGVFIVHARRNLKQQPAGEAQ